MTNEEVAKYFANLPPNEEAKILLIDGDILWAQELLLDPPGTNLDDLHQDLDEAQTKMITAFKKC